MRNSRPPKWDWATHWPQMEEFYHLGQTIPQIHRAIQRPGFRPSQRAVYDRFHLEGLSTEHGRKPKALHAGSPADTEASISLGSRQVLPAAMLEQTSPTAAECIPIEDGKETSASTTLDTYSMSKSAEEFTHHEPCASETPLPAPEKCLSESFAASAFFDRTRFAGKEGIDDAIVTASADLATQVPASCSPDETVSDEPEKGRRHERKKRNILGGSLSASENNQIIENLAGVGMLTGEVAPYLINVQHSGGRTRHPHRPKEAVASSHSRPKTSIGKICSLLHKKDGASKARAEQGSPFADNDSGYYSGHSGRGTPSTLHLRDSLMSHPDSLTEFRGLYRIACYTLHEPKSFDQHMETQHCQFCGCSSIHILAWLANRLKLDEFKAELKSMDLQNIQALDAAGNSALHYGAISGASYAHLKALMDAGVPLYERNTANQNFLHCLRRCDDGAESFGLDCYQHGLVNLLEFFQLQNGLNQQDNDGQTVLHVLASHIIEPELRDQTFKIFRNHGLSWTVLNRFRESPKDLAPPDYKPGQTMFAAETFNTIGRSPRDLELGMSEWEQNVLRQMNARNILIVEAQNNPHYVDGTTKDTVLHALSIVSMQHHEIMRYLRQFVLGDVNLNRHNCEGHHPLLAFICNQSFRVSETGATMAKYIDILLWKGGKHGDLTDINVNMMSRNGTTALYEAAIRAQSDAVRSLIEAGANVNARRNNDPRGPSILLATFAARDKAVLANERIRMHMFKEVISHLEHAGALLYPNSLQERGRAT